MSTLPHCQVCAGARMALYHRDANAELFRCEECGFVFLHPIPDAATQASLYEQAGIGARYFPKAERKLQRAKQKMRQLQRVVARGRFLDAGCNGGFMVEAARRAGFDAHGVEPDPASVDWARQHFPANAFSVATLEEYVTGGAQRPFDLVYCSEVIEHAPDANRFAAALAAAVARGGYLYLTTPDITHWRRPRALAEWDGYKPPEHCLYFSPRTLRLLLERHGFTGVKTAWAWKPGIKVLARRA